MAPAITTPPVAIPIPNAPLTGQPGGTVPADLAVAAPNWAHLMIRTSEFLVGGLILVIGVAALLKRATGIPTPRTPLSRLVK